MANWYKNEFEESFYLEKETGRLICGFHPKPTREYALHLAKKVFENNRDLNYWYNFRSFWYGDIAPIEMTNKQLINTIMNIEYNNFI
jgi:hypothetical protein